MYAVVKTGGKQYRVAAGDKIKVEQIAADVGQEIVLEQVVAVFDGKTNSILHVFLGSNPHCFIAVRNILQKGVELRPTATRATP